MICEPSLPSALPWQPNRGLAILRLAIARVAVPMAVADAIHPPAIFVPPHPYPIVVPPCGTHDCTLANITQHLEQLIAKTNDEQR